MDSERKIVFEVSVPASVKAVAKIAAKESRGRYSLEGVRVTANGSTRMEATDGRVLLRVDLVRGEGDQGEGAITLSAKHLSDALAAIGKASRKEVERPASIRVMEGDSAAEVWGAGIMHRVQILDGPYPKMDDVIPDPARMEAPGSDGVGLSYSLLPRLLEVMADIGGKRDCTAVRLRVQGESAPARIDWPGSGDHHALTMVGVIMPVALK